VNRSLKLARASGSRSQTLTSLIESVLLMRRREAIHARKGDARCADWTNRTYLLGVYDLSRMGALHFPERDSPVFQSADTTMALPPRASLRDLEYAIVLVGDEAGEEVLDPPARDTDRSRPKASVRDSAGEL